MTSLYLIRHAETSGNADGRFQGRTDLQLTPNGMRQAKVLAARFRCIPLSAVYTSPLRRARDTALSLAAPHGLRPVIEEGLVEIDGGGFENRLFTELWQECPKEFGAFCDTPGIFGGYRGGESPRAALDRMREAVLDIAERHRGGTVAALSHGYTIRCFLCYALGYPLDELAQVGWGANTSVNHITFDGRMRPRVMRMHDISHLPEGFLVRQRPSS